MTHRSRRGGIIQGCLVALGVLLLLLIIAAVLFFVYWRDLAASGTVAATEAVLQESTLPQEQKDQILADVRALGEDLKSGKVSAEEFARVFEEVSQGPLLPLAGVEAARQKYIEPAGMSPEEKAAAELALQRFARGIYEGRITPAEEEITDTIKPIVRLKPGNQWEFKENATREEVDQFVANAKRKADAAGVPEEPFDLNIADELRKAIDRARGRGSLSDAPPDSAPPTPVETPPGPGGG